MIRIIIIEDQVILRDSLEKLLDSKEDLQVVASSGDAEEALGLCKALSPDLVLMDVITGDKTSGIAAASRIRIELPRIKIIIITALPEITFVEAAKKAGVQSFIYKNIKSDVLISTIYNTMDGYSIYPTASPVKLAFNSSFTDREIAIIRLVCQTKNRKEIAKTLNISEGTVKASITEILNKTGFDSIMKFAVYAVANGLIIPQGS